MKNKILAAAILLLAATAGAVDSNRGVSRADVADRLWPADHRHIVYFTATTTAQNSALCLVSTMTQVQLSTVSYGVSFTPTLSASTTTTYGGRAYMAFQVTGGTSNVSVGYASSISTGAASPYLSLGQWFSPDDPVAWQGQVWLISPSTFSVSGWLFFDRPR